MQMCIRDSRPSFAGSFLSSDTAESRRNRIVEPLENERNLSPVPADDLGVWELLKGARENQTQNVDAYS